MEPNKKAGKSHANPRHQESDQDQAAGQNQKYRQGSGKKQPESPLLQKARRIIAWIAIILLAGMYILTLVAALLSSPSRTRLFRLCLGLTIAVPVAAWILIYAIGYFSGRHTIASVDLLNSNKEARREMEDALEKQQEKDSNKKH